MTITLEEAQAKLPELLRHLVPGDQMEITEAGQPLAVITRSAQTSWPSEPGTAKPPRKLGTMAGTVLSMEHFDDPIEGFEEYMP